MREDFAYAYAKSWTGLKLSGVLYPIDSKGRHEPTIYHEQTPQVVATYVTLLFCLANSP